MNGIVSTLFANLRTEWIEILTAWRPARLFFWFANLFFYTLLIATYGDLDPKIGNPGAPIVEFVQSWVSPIQTAAMWLAFLLCWTGWRTFEHRRNTLLDNTVPAESEAAHLAD